MSGSTYADGLALGFMIGVLIMALIAIHIIRRG